MIKHLAGTLLVGLAVFACSGGSGTIGEGTLFQEQGELTAPSGLTVTATITAVTLGDDCGSGAPAAGFAGDCAPAEDESGRAAGGCGGGGWCQQSNVQLAFNAAAGTTGATITVLQVTLHDATDGSQVDALEASNPRAWDGSTYAPWTGAIAPSSDVKATFDLSAPSWSTMASGDEWSTYSQKFRLRVTLQIDGATMTIESNVLDREPAVAT
jgi:hypothetical protein